MGVVLAAIDNTATAMPVLAAATSLAGILGADVEAVHVREDGDLTVQGAASVAGIELREVFGPVIPSLIAEAGRDGVDAVAIGTRGTPVGRHPAGHVAMAVMTSLTKPLLAVPPELRLPVELGRVLVPLNGTSQTAAALRGTIELACHAAMDVVVLHVHSGERLPLFDDQPQHERPAWEQEFLARYCPKLPDGLHLEVRVGPAGAHVLEVAGEIQADLVALGWSQDLSPGRAEVVREVLAHSRVPVLLVPMDAERVAEAWSASELVATA
jgi:nucleotide-binding universal stress UspA family protein